MKNETMNPRKVKVRLPKLRRGEGRDDLFVAVNGENYLIRRGAEVEIPYYVAEVIERSQDMAEAADEFIRGKVSEV